MVTKEAPAIPISSYCVGDDLASGSGKVRYSLRSRDSMASEDKTEIRLLRSKLEEQKHQLYDRGSARNWKVLEDEQRPVRSASGFGS